MDKQRRLEVHLLGFYDLLNSRDLESCLDRMTEDVDWHNAMEGTREIGRAAVRQCWTRQFALVSARATPLSVRFEADGAAVVTVDQVVRALDGQLRCHTTVLHRYRLRGGKLAQMDAMMAPPGSGRV